MTVKEYFERYIAVDTQSDSASGEQPSTAGQLMLGMILVGDLLEMGVHAQMDEFGYVYGEIPASAGCEERPAIGLIAHMDTSEAASGRDIRFRTIEYKGGDIVRSAEKNIVMRVSDFPDLNDQIGKHLIITDGTTLLGADDKAGIAEIMALCETLLQNKTLSHGPIRIAFTPDEEIGQGTAHFDLERFGADFAYTVDGGALGELEYENFNAASATLEIAGVSTHPGTARGKMVNACLVAHEFVSLLPQDARPETTMDREGFFHLCDMTGDCEHAKLSYIIRDHDREKFEQKKAFFQSAAALVREKYPKAAVTATVKDSYFNMIEVMREHMDVVDRAARAMRACGVEPIVQPIRGGTDGAMLSFRGLPCPNLSTGGYHFHGRFEYIPAESMETMVRVLTALVCVEE